MAHLEAAGGAAALADLFLSSLPLRTTDDETAQGALRILCMLLDDETTAPAVLGSDGAKLPQVLAVMGAAAGKAATGDELSAAMKRSNYLVFFRMQVIRGLSSMRS